MCRYVFQPLSNFWVLSTVKEGVRLEVARSITEAVASDTIHREIEWRIRMTREKMVVTQLRCSRMYRNGKLWNLSP